MGGAPGRTLSSPPARPQTPGIPETRQDNAGDRHQPLGRAAGAAAGGDVHRHRRARPQYWDRQQKELPSEREYRERCGRAPERLEWGRGAAGEAGTLPW